MKGKIKKFLIMFLTLAVVLSFCLTAAACGEEKEPGPDDPKPGGEVTVTELVISEQPDKTEYYVGESFDPTGMIVKAKWSDGLKTSIDIADCTITPSGGLTASDTKVTISYEGKSVDQPITIKNINIGSITVDTGNAPLKGAVGTPMDFSQIEVTAHYEDGGSNIVTGGYTVSVKLKDSQDEATVIEDLSAVTFDDRGTYVFTVTYGDVSASFEVEILNGFIIEAENIKNEATEEDKNYVEIVKASSQGSPYGIFKPGEPASGGGYMGSVFNGSVIRFHAWAEEDCYANVILRASSANMLIDGGSWSPIEMGDQQFNRLFETSYGSAAEAESGSLTPLYVEDDVILKGGRTDKPTGDPLLYVHWMDVNFGTLPLKKGDNIIELNVITDYQNCYGQIVACNIDRLEVEYTEDYTPPATVESLTVKTPPTKTEYKFGETFDPTGMVIEANMSDDTTEPVDLAKCTITPSGALTAADTEVTITYRGASVKQAITVTAAENIVFEAENIKTAEDGEKFYTESVRAGYQGGASVQNTEAPEAGTSGGAYLKGLWGSSDGQNGAIVRFHIWSDTAQRATIKLSAANSNVEVSGDGNPWHPSKTGDVQFNQIFKAKFGTADNLTDVTVGDDVIVEGGEVGEEVSEGWSFALFEKWQDITIGTFDLVEGDNILELENINSTLKNLAGEIYGLNIDTVKIEFGVQ